VTSRVRHRLRQLAEPGFLRAINASSSARLLLGVLVGSTTGSQPRHPPPRLPFGGPAWSRNTVPSPVGREQDITL